MTNSILIGPAATLLQSTTYALPARLVNIMSSAALEISLDNSAWSTLSGSTTGTTVTAVFVRCTTAAPVVVCRV